MHWLFNHVRIGREQKGKVEKEKVFFVFVCFAF
jgi:hypothetical protein